MILSFHPIIEADENVICAGRLPDKSDLERIRRAEAVIVPQGCSEALYRMATTNCAHVFPNMDIRFDYPGKLEQISLFQKFDVDPVESAHLVSEISGVYIYGIDIVDNYAYVSVGNSLSIINVDPLLETPEVIKNIDGMYNAADVAVSDGFAYTTGSALVCIADVDPVETADKIGQVDVPHQGSGIDVLGDYAYAAYSYDHDYNGDGGMRIFYLGDW